MELYILSISDAVIHQPIKPTYAIRIFSSFSTERPQLAQSALYSQTREYVFDDNDTHPWRIEVGPKWFDEETAERMIRDFLDFREDVGALMVHCSRGENRSPAVAIALNDYFNLGADRNMLTKRYPHYNRFVCKTLMATAERAKQTP